jgi:hypothetical protein
LIGVAIDKYIIPHRVAEIPYIAGLMLVTYLCNNIFQVWAGRDDGHRIATCPANVAAGFVYASATLADAVF